MVETETWEKVKVFIYIVHFFSSVLLKLGILRGQKVFRMAKHFKINIKEKMFKIMWSTICNYKFSVKQAPVKRSYGADP